MQSDQEKEAVNRHTQTCTDITQWVHSPMLVMYLHQWALLVFKNVYSWIWAELVMSTLQPSENKKSCWTTHECICLPLRRNLEWVTSRMLIFGVNRDLRENRVFTHWLILWGGFDQLYGLYNTIPIPNHVAFTPNTHSGFWAVWNVLQGIKMQHHGCLAQQSHGVWTILVFGSKRFCP